MEPEALNPANVNPELFQKAQLEIKSLEAQMQRIQNTPLYLEDVVQQHIDLLKLWTAFLIQIVNPGRVEFDTYLNRTKDNFSDIEKDTASNYFEFETDQLVKKYTKLIFSSIY